MKIQLHSSWLDGAGLSALVKIRFQELLYKGWLRWQEHSAGDWAVQSVVFTEILWRVSSLCKQQLLESGYEFGRINHKESLAGIFLLRVDNI